MMSPKICGRRASARLVKSLFDLEVYVNKFLKALLKTGVYLLEQSDRVTTEMQYETLFCHLYETRTNAPVPFWNQAGPREYNNAT